ncbi:D-arabinono-1,4-lactone oxidase [Ascoidea rubescens DSM 1968]|uniref:D-arabinono-1,4-lactone oxidase n=1 Tax=Ascoidea rubescens DSM 1968 TaxID=1344418 RepID=A0A1D2VAP4_9ASCO|nr:D-arabinono-1,4-lactone oxidase [Ascoidea rubescens DSM 1968]ODV58513.1 D-arabinono-1,4-lactone oxidase [Ascoidea rubescens DSM 1968]
MSSPNRLKKSDDSSKEEFEVDLLPKNIQNISVSKLFHRTWAGTFICYPQIYFQPKTLDEIISLIKNARSFKKNIMVVGSGHSPSDLTMTNSQNWLVNLDKFNRILNISPHSSKKFTDVTVESGIRLYQINHFLAEKGLALQNLGSITDQSIAGVISTGTHGASPYHGLISQQITDLTIINGKGDLIKCSPLENQDLFRASLLSLGKIGIIVQVTIRTIPAFKIKSTQQVINFNTLLLNWDSIWLSSEFIRIWWFPYSKKCILWRGNKSNKPLSNPRKSWYGTKFGRLFYETLLWFSVHVYPKLTPFIENFVFNRQYGKTETFLEKNGGDVAVQTSTDGFWLDCLFSQYVNEWAAPLSNGVEILRSLDHSIEQAKLKNDFFVHAPIEVRCSNTTFSGVVTSDNLPDPIELSKRKYLDVGAIPGNNLRPLLDNTPKLNYIKPFSIIMINEDDQTNITNSQLTLYINVTMYRPFKTSVPIGKWFKIFEDTLDAAGGKPHWAKNFIGSETYLPKSLQEQNIKNSKQYKDGEMIGFASKMNEWFGEELQMYQQIRRKQDPDGVFLSGTEWAVRNGIIEESDVRI